MKEIFRPKDKIYPKKEMRLYSEKNTFAKKKGSGKKKLQKLIVAAFTATSATAIFAVSILAFSLNSVSLYAKTANSLTFYADYGESESVVYTLTDNADYYYSQESVDNPAYVYFDGLNPETEYTFTIRDMATETVLFERTYYTSNLEVNVSAEFSYYEGEIYGYVSLYGKKTEELSEYLTIQIQDSASKNVYSKDLFSWDEEIHIPNCTDDKYNITIKYGGTPIYAQTLKKYEEKYGYVDAKMIEGDLYILYSYFGYDDVSITVTSDSGTLYDKKLTSKEEQIILPSIEAEEIMVLLLTGKDVIYETSVYQEEKYFRPEINSSFENELRVNYLIDTNMKNSYSLIISDASGADLYKLEDVNYSQYEVSLSNISANSVILRFYVDDVLYYEKEIEREIVLPAFTYEIKEVSSTADSISFEVNVLSGDISSFSVEVIGAKITSREKYFIISGLESDTEYEIKLFIDGTYDKSIYASTTPLSDYSFEIIEEASSENGYMLVFSLESDLEFELLCYVDEEDIDIEFVDNAYSIFVPFDPTHESSMNLYILFSGDDEPILIYEKTLTLEE